MTRGRFFPTVFFRLGALVTAIIVAPAPLRAQPPTDRFPFARPAPAPAMPTPPAEIAVTPPMLGPAADGSTSTRVLARELMQWLPLNAQGGTSQRRIDRVLSQVPVRRTLSGSVPYLAPNPTLNVRPGSVFNPGASGPGVVSNSDREPFLGGTFDPRSGWPLVILDHFKPDPERTQALWIASSYYCPQEMTPGNGKLLTLRQFGADGQLVRKPTADLYAEAARGKVVFIQVHGNLTYADTAIGSGLWSHTWLHLNGGIPPDSLFVVFDWPSWRVKRSDFKDVHEKGRRSYIAGLHLAELIAGFPPGSRICLLGQSYGGRAAFTALHLLAGGEIDASDGTPPVRLNALPCDIHIRCISLATAADRDWLLPGKRFERAIVAAEGILNLYNPGDEALLLYPLLLRSGHRAALGRAGMTDAQRARLGPFAARYAQRDISQQLGTDHSLLDATSDTEIARWIAPYAWAPPPEAAR